MKVLHGNTFLYFGDKNVSKVSGVWKVLHISIYAAIAVNAFVTSMSAGNMFQTFKYNCILFCNEVDFEKEVVPIDYFEHSKSKLVNNINLFEPGEKAKSNTDAVTEDLNQNITENMLVNSTDLKGSTDIPNQTLNNANSNAENANKENGSIIFKNQTHIFQTEDDSIAIIYGKIDVRKTRFSSNSWCNFVLGIALITFIFSTFCVVLLTMCSKGGKGRSNTLNRPQNLVYPILVSSVLLGILNLTASIIIKNGMRDFCANFELFTEDQRCSSIINQFTIHEKQESFYVPYVVLSYSSTLTIILFACQILVTLLRILYAVDYQLYSLEVDNDEEETNFEIEDGQIKERTL